MSEELDCLRCGACCHGEFERYVRVTGGTAPGAEANSCSVRLTTLGSPTQSLDITYTGTMQ